MSGLLSACINHIRIKHIAFITNMVHFFLSFQKNPMLITNRYAKYYIRELSNIKINVKS